MRRSATRQRRFDGRLATGAGLVMAVLAFAACGGSGDSSGIGSGGSGNANLANAGGGNVAPAPTPTPAPAPAAATVPGLTVGTISGFGSVIVNGVEWDETHAVVRGDDGALLAGTDLLLGRQVSIAGPVDPQTARGTAAIIEVRRALVGRVDTLDASGRPVVLGLPVAIDAGTAWGGGRSAGGTFAAGDRIVVYGVVPDATSPVRASRIEATAAVIALREGIASGSRYDRCAFMLGTLSVDCSSALLPGGPRVPDGARVRVAAARDAHAGVLQVDRVDLLSPASATAGSQVSAEGSISAISGTRIGVQGYQFDIATAAVTAAPASGLTVGLHVEVAGTAGADGTVVATTVKVEQEDETLGREFEATGTISSFASASSFFVRGVQIDASGAHVTNGTVADLANGVAVQVEGRLVDGIVRATQVEIDR